MGRNFLCEVPERFFCDVEMKARLSCITENVVDPCVWAIHRAKMHTGSGTNPRKLYISGSQGGGAEPLKSFNIRHSSRSVVLALLGFSFALVQYFLKILSCLPFGIAINNLCHFMLEVWDCLLILKGRQQDFHVSQKRVPS